MPKPLSITPRSIRPFSYCFLSFPQTTWPEPRATGEEALWTLRLSIKATFTSFYSHMVSLQSSHRITWNQMAIVATVSVRSHQLTRAMWSYQTVWFSTWAQNGQTEPWFFRYPHFASHSASHVAPMETANGTGSFTLTWVRPQAGCEPCHPPRH